MPSRATGPTGASFSERGFYLREFQGRTLGLACGTLGAAELDAVRSVLAALARNRTRAVVISTRRATLESLGVAPSLTATSPRFEGSVWRVLRRGRRVGVLASARHGIAVQAGAVALRLRLFKLVLLDRQGGVRPRGGAALSFVHRRELARLLRARRLGTGGPRHAFLHAVERMLDAGLPAVNVCTPAGLDAELFTYAGSGTLFTRDRYVDVRPLGVDDYETAYDLYRRGVREGFLAPRTPEEFDRVLARGFGAFVEGEHLAGIGALLEHPGTRTGEIASLYTVTRFLGEGMGKHLLAFALARAREERLRRVFACTTSERVGAFFRRYAFRPVEHETLPASKWRGYDPERRARLRCYARDVVRRAHR